MPGADPGRHSGPDGRPPACPRPASSSRGGAWMSEGREQQRHRDRVRREEVMSLPVLRVRHHGVIGGRDGDVLVCASVGQAGEVAAVWTAPEGVGAVTSTTVSAAGACLPDPAAARPVAARITVHTPELAAVTPIADLALAHITVQPMPGGRFLVAGARCRWRRDGPDRNGVLYDTDGQVVCEGVLGDGIGMSWPPATGRSGSATSMREFTATTAGARTAPKSRWAPTGSSGSLPDWSLSGTTPDIPRSDRGMRSVTAMPST